MNTEKTIKQEMLISLNAMFIAVPEDIANDIKNKVLLYTDQLEALLLTATQNLGHPAYNHSSSTTIAIDEIREQLFDFLNIPKQ